MSNPAPPGPWTRRNLLASLLTLLLLAVALRLLGRLWWCACGQHFLWAGDIWTRHASQHLADPYSFTHVLHGVLYYALLWPLRRWIPLEVRAFLAVLIASGWELLENSNMVIQRYRTVTISLDYFGDSIVNSLSDVCCCALGFTLTWRLPAWAGLLFFVAVEVLLLFWIRDSLVLNIVMLVAPLQSLRAWQLRH